MLVFGCNAQSDSLFEHSIFHSPLDNVSGIDGDIVAITEDEQGFIWFVASNGLWRWDGHYAERAVFVEQSAEAQSPFIQAAHADKTGQIWVGTNRGLFRLDTQQRQLYTVQHDQLSTLSLQNITSAAEPAHLFIAADRAVYQYDVESNQLTLLPLPYDARIHALIVHKQHLWVGSGNGLLNMPLAESEKMLNPVENFESEIRISVFATTQRQELLVGTANRGLFVETQNEHFEQVRFDDKVQPWIYSITVTDANKVLLGTFGKGLLTLDVEQLSVRRAFFDPLHPAGLANDNVWALYTDSRGLVWIGANTALQIYQPAANGISHILGGIGSFGGLNQRHVHSVQSRNNDLIVGTGNSGLERLNPITGHAEALYDDGNDPIETLIVAEDQRLFASSNFKSMLIDAKSAVQEPIVIPGRPVNKYSSAFAQRNGVMWVAGTDGLWAYHQATNTARNLLAQATHERRVASLLMTEDRLWIGSWRGLYVLDQPNLDSTEIKVAPHAPVSLQEQFIPALFADSREQIWAGTSNAGLFVYRKDGQWQQLHIAPGELGGTVEAIAGESDGRVYISTSKSIIAVDITTYEVTTVLNGPSAINAPFRRGAATKTANEIMVFGGLNGLTLIEPNELVWTPKPRQVVLTGGTVITADDVQLTPELFDRNIQTPTLIKRLSFEFAALDYLTPQQVFYRYRLLGLDDTWTETDAGHRVATFTQPQPGSYVFQVEYSLDGQQWFDNSIERQIIIPAAWYQTGIARFLFGLLVCVLVFMLHRLRVQKLNRRQLVLEQRVAERTAELLEANKTLNKQAQALREASMTDALTGLHNRRFLTQNIERDVTKLQRYYADCAKSALTADENTDVLFFLIDIDHFKSINDTYGHHMGDLVLIETSLRLKQVFREIDYLIRWGGEEFLVVVHDTPRKDATELAERVINVIGSKPFKLKNNLEVNITCSIGYAAYPLASKHFAALSWEATIGIADAGLYAAKNNNRNTWFGFTSVRPETNEQDMAKVQQDPAFVFEYGVLERRATTKSNTP
ncbi:diguanylate cyclase [Alteromonas sp. ASW11-36]|uniref:diguanylate cyclase n=1 Tax=Alteromonas arenosi TaxID=3055817 RepID=A0ABT7SU96_9ALTE|nr:ligand-binding sensor domain-containing diguanylate cyclase [Alteromonas sp. ASW11-36]MDM7859579.1 diguanylate cyclase [Alteromonas sp. ASW11-36]